MAKDDKLKALDAAIAQIERQYGKGSVMKLGDNSANMNVETVPTGSLSLDIALGLGGLPKGRIIEIYGPESSGLILNLKGKEVGSRWNSLISASFFDIVCPMQK